MLAAGLSDKAQEVYATVSGRALCHVSQGTFFTFIYNLSRQAFLPHISLLSMQASQACRRKTWTLPLTKPTFSTLQKCGISAILMTFNDLISYLDSIL